MAAHDWYQHVEISDGGRTVAAAEVIISGGSGGTARASLRAESGHIAPGRRASLVDAVLDLPAVRESARLAAVFPLGDSESLHRLEQRCRDVRTRPAGSTAILEADLQPGDGGRAAQDPVGEADPGRGDRLRSRAHRAGEPGQSGACCTRPCRNHGPTGPRQRIEIEGAGHGRLGDIGEPQVVLGGRRPAAGRRPRPGRRRHAPRPPPWPARLPRGWSGQQRAARSQAGPRRWPDAARC